MKPMKFFFTHRILKERSNVCAHFSASNWVMTVALPFVPSSLKNPNNRRENDKELTTTLTATRKPIVSDLSIFTKNIQCFDRLITDSGKTCYNGMVLSRLRDACWEMKKLLYTVCGLVQLLQQKGYIISYSLRSYPVNLKLISFRILNHTAFFYSHWKLHHTVLNVYCDLS